MLEATFCDKARARVVEVRVVRIPASDLQLYVSMLMYLPSAVRCERRSCDHLLTSAATRQSARFVCDWNF